MSLKIFINISRVIGVVLLHLFILTPVVASVERHVYDFDVEDAAGKLVSMRTFKGKVLLIVNVASECGFTDSHYKSLVTLQTELGNEHFQVLAFPCNDFGQQEPKPVNEIQRFVGQTYHVNFPIFQKVNIVTESPSPLFLYLQEQAKDKVVWNFHKFLLNSEGVLIGAWGPAKSVEEIAPLIRNHVYGWKQRAGQHRGSRSEF